jgi:hypothetical protein
VAYLIFVRPFKPPSPHAIAQGAADFRAASLLLLDYEMKRDFEAALLRGDYLPRAGENPLIMSYKFLAGEVGMYMSYWYGGLFVVCEGWIELGLSDPKVDLLVADSRLSALKRYRHGAFHFQSDYFDTRFKELPAENLSASWVSDLSEALGAWFLRWLQARKSKRDESSNHPKEA